MSKPPWVHYSLTPQWLAVTRELTQSLDARLILGINFEADSDVLARTEASALMRGVGPRSVVALELGNEPELYHSFGWYRGPNGQEVTGRPADYDFDMFEREFTSVASALRGVPVAGPTTGGHYTRARAGVRPSIPRSITSSTGPPRPASRPAASVWCGSHMPTAFRCGSTR